MTSSRKTPSTGRTGKSPKTVGVSSEFWKTWAEDWKALTTTSTNLKTWTPGSFPPTVTYTYSWAPDFDPEELEALIGTVVDSIVARAVGPGGGDLPEPVESEPAGFIYLPEGISVTPSVWRSESLNSSETSTVYWSSSTEGYFTLS